MRYDLAFFTCCCKSFLGSDHHSTSSYYDLLGVDRDASADEIKRAYKRQSLQMHPDKLAQRGLPVTDEDKARFTRMKEAYEVLSDPHKRDTYDAIGERGMKWLEEPFSIDPQELAHNFATSSVLDRAKIFAIFVAIAIAILIQPILICLQVDGALGPSSSWVAIFTPLWLWNTFILFYHARVIMMGPIPRPDTIPEQDWVDPLPMEKRIASMLRFVLIVVFEILVAVRLDNFLPLPWTVVFFPLYIWEGTTMYKKFPLARMRIVSLEDLEQALGKPFAQFTAAEKELIASRYAVVPSTSSPEFEAAQKVKTRARHDIAKSIFRIVFAIVILIQLDGKTQWNWWLVFLPFWVMTVIICLANYQAFVEVHRAAAEKDPTLFSLPKKENTETVDNSSNCNSGATTTTQYGAVGTDGTATADEVRNDGTTAATSTSKLSEEEREELKAQVMASSGRLCSKCCSQGFLLLVVLLFVGKIQGAGYSSFWIIAPFLTVASLILCCLGLAIFGITEVSTDGVEFEGADYYDVETGKARTYTAAPTTNTSPPIVLAPPAASVMQHVEAPSNDTQNNNNGGDVIAPSAILSPAATSVVTGAPPPPHTQTFDLLDDHQPIDEKKCVTTTNIAIPMEPTTPGELHELD